MILQNLSRLFTAILCRFESGNRGRKINYPLYHPVLSIILLNIQENILFSGPLNFKTNFTSETNLQGRLISKNGRKECKLERENCISVPLQNTYSAVIKFWLFYRETAM